ncbi:hypothetical protein [Chitinibacter sp. GC72]|uniref:hypothetical protein n=1 Tax=Chitinibacter sp. GC72 TaxID=1526917 RepID=UPI0012FBEA48|nr:hypothetical protein [Chitinibacter sp. GC72]
MPKLAAKPEGKILNSIDGVLYCYKSSSTSVAYLLAACALFETYDQAMLALEATDQEEQVVSSRQTIRINEYELLKYYAASNGDYRATTELFPNINDFVVRNRLQALGLPNFGGRGHPNLLQAASAFYLEQKSLIESATVFDIPLPQLESLVRNVGVSMAKVLKMIAQGGEQRFFTKTQQNLPTVCFAN